MSVGCSSLAGTTRMCKNAVTRHAEMDAISKYKNKERLKKASLWSVRWKVNEDGEIVLANAKPCIYCRNLALKCGIKTIFYSNDNGTINRETTNEIQCHLTPASVIHLRDSNGYKSVQCFNKNER